MARSRRRAQRDERAALGDEALEVVDAVVADAAAVLGPDRQRVEAVEDLARRLVGQDDRVEPLPQAARADVGVVDRRRRELVLLEHPARPALVDVAAGPRRVQPDARRADGDRAGRVGDGRGVDAGGHRDADVTRRRVDHVAADVLDADFGRDAVSTRRSCDGGSNASRAPAFSSRFIAIAVSAPT